MCKEEFSTPEMNFRDGKEDTGNQFRYAICTCPKCKGCLGFVKV